MDFPQAKSDSFLFPSVSFEDWKETALRELKGKPLEAIYHKPEPGLFFSPYFEASSEKEASTFRNQVPGAFPFARGTTAFNSWKTILPLDYKWDEPEVVQKLAQNDKDLEFEIPVFHLLEKEGAERFFLRLPHSISVGLKGAELLLPAWILWRKTRNSDPTFLQFHPFDSCILKGWSPAWKDSFNALQEYTNETGFSGNWISLDSTEAVSCGASAFQEIAILLSMTAEMAHETSDAIFSQMVFRLSGTSSFFSTLAKIRAFRQLYSAVLSAYGKANSTGVGPKVECGIHPSLISVTDVHTNLLRFTTTCLSAVMGGAEKIAIPPFRQSREKEAYFPLRMARNISLLLKDEAKMAEVIDPAAGAWYIEILTEEIAARAWDWFLEIENQGGFSKALKSGFIQQALQKNVENQDQKWMHGEKSLVGINTFPPPADEFLVPNFSSQELPISETDREILGHLHSLPASTWGDVLEDEFLGKKKNSKIAAPIRTKEFSPVLPYTAKREFEGIRLKAEIFFRQTETRPKVALFTFGDIKMRIARANFASNTIGLSGMECIENPFPDDPDQAIVWLHTQSWALIVFCSADENYFKSLPAFIKKIQKRDARFILAGKPEDLSFFENLGLDLFLFKKMDLTKFLKQLLERFNSKEERK